MKSNLKLHRSQFVPARRQRGAAWLPWLLLLLLVVAAAAAGWYGYPRAKAQLDQVQSERELLGRLNKDVSALRARLQEIGETQLEVGGRMDRSEQQLGQVKEAVDAGRGGVQLAAVEQLLLLANDHLLLADDAGTAARALAEADRRLGRLQDPSLMPVREALAKERAALAALPQTDRAGSALLLGELIRQAAAWPLRARSPDHYSTVQEAREEAAPQGWPQRLWGSVTHALAGMFTIRRTQGPAPRLLPPGEEALVSQALRLKLEGARLAVLAGDVAAVREMSESAADWLHDYYNEGDPAVAGARRQLAELAKAAVVVPRPDISGSLARLRQITSQRSAN